MSFFKSALALTDEKLHDLFAATKPDATKLRAPMVKGLDRTLTQYQEGKSKVPHRWWSVSNDIVAFQAKLGGDVIRINKQDTLYIPAERFPDFVSAMKSAVEAGEFDDELANHGKGDAAVSIPKARKPRQARPEGSSGKREWTPERKAKFAATIAARNAAKGG